VLWHWLTYFYCLCMLLTAEIQNGRWWSWYWGNVRSTIFEWSEYERCSCLCYLFDVPFFTSNVTGRHHRSKHKLWAGFACATHFCKFFEFSHQLSYNFRFHVHILCMVWHCTGQHFISMYVLRYHLYVGTWRPLVNVITTLLPAKSIFFAECGIVHFRFAMHVFEVRASSLLPRLPLWKI